MATNYGTPFLRLQASGPLYVAEAWSCTLSFAGAGTPPAPTQAAVDACGAAWSAFFSDTTNGALIAQKAALQVVKVARIGGDGLYMDPKATEWAAGGATGVIGAGNTNPAPQLALAVTLEGPNPRGAAGRGRFYIPAPAGVVMNDGRVSADYAGAVGTAAARLIRQCEAALGLEAHIVGAATKTGRGPARQEVAAVSVGRVLDTIRSRRTSLPEERVYDAGFGGQGGGF